MEESGPNTQIKTGAKFYYLGGLFTIGSFNEGDNIIYIKDDKGIISDIPMASFKSLVRDGTYVMEEQKVKTAEEIPFQELIVSKYVTVFMPHFNQNVRLRIESRAVWDSDNVCIRLHGRVGKNVIVSEPIFSQDDLNKMSHIFQPMKP